MHGLKTVDEYTWQAAALRSGEETGNVWGDGLFIEGVMSGLVADGQLFIEGDRQKFRAISVDRFPPL